MGRHSSGEQWPFFRSAIGWWLPWAVIAFFIAAALYFALDTLGDDTVRTSAECPGAEATLPAGDESPTPEETETEKTEPAEPTTEPAEKKKPARKDPTEPKKSDKKKSSGGGLITEGITVQVLNASDQEAADDVMADRLARLGFEIVAVEQASKSYPQTTVFYSSEDSRPAAEKLAAKYDWIVEEKPENLSPDVSVHVIVGDDF